jgi:hypothetical protein
VPDCRNRRSHGHARFRDGIHVGAGRRDLESHRRRSQHGPVYWTTCRVTACEPGREFGFDALVGERAANTWHYRLTPVDGGTEVTESFRMPDSAFTKLFSVLGGQLRQRRNIRDMRTTLERIKVVVEAPEGA